MLEILPMEQPSVPAASSGDPVRRKKRSNSHRRPHPNPKPVNIWQNDSPFSRSSTDSGVLGDPNSHVGLGVGNYGHASANNIRPDENCQEEPRAALLGSNNSGNENKPGKVKLKLGGITRTIQAKSKQDISSVGGDIRSLDATDSRCSLQRQDASGCGTAINGNYKLKLVHKSKQVKKHVAHHELDDEDDAEIRYLKKLRASKGSSGHLDRLDEIGKSKGRVSTSGDVDYELEFASDDLTEPTVGPGLELTITTRKRALESSEFGSLLEFPTGLPVASSKKQKLPEVEQQLRKAEAAERRKLKAEKAAKEAEAEAIRKILGQDSIRKKKEEKLKKRQEELAQKKTAKAVALGPSTVRCIMGPHGTIVTFSDDIGLPKIFDSMPCRYPLPREKCVGPNCTNEYKYRDSKSKLPLCSLHCYKAVHGNMELLPAC